MIACLDRTSTRAVAVVLDPASSSGPDPSGTNRPDDWAYRSRANRRSACCEPTCSLASLMRTWVMHTGDVNLICKASEHAPVDGDPCCKTQATAAGWDAVCHSSAIVLARRHRAEKGCRCQHGPRSPLFTSSNGSMPVACSRLRNSSRSPLRAICVLSSASVLRTLFLTRSPHWCSGGLGGGPGPCEERASLGHMMQDARKPTRLRRHPLCLPLCPRSPESQVCAGQINRRRASQHCIPSGRVCAASARFKVGSMPPQHALGEPSGRSSSPLRLPERSDV